MHSPFGPDQPRRGAGLRKALPPFIRLHAARTEDAIVLSLRRPQLFRSRKGAVLHRRSCVRCCPGHLDALCSPRVGVDGNDLSRCPFVRARSAASLQRMAAETLARVSGSAACPENLAGAREMPVHPLSSAVQVLSAHAMNRGTGKFLRRSNPAISARMRELTEPSRFLWRSWARAVFVLSRRAAEELAHPRGDGPRWLDEERRRFWVDSIRMRSNSSATAWPSAKALTIADSLWGLLRHRTRPPLRAGLAFSRRGPSEGGRGSRCRPPV